MLCLYELNPLATCVIASLLLLAGFVAGIVLCGIAQEK